MRDRTRSLPLAQCQGNAAARTWTSRSRTSSSSSLWCRLPLAQVAATRFKLSRKEMQRAQHKRIHVKQMLFTLEGSPHVAKPEGGRNSRRAGLRYVEDSACEFTLMSHATVHSPCSVCVCRLCYRILDLVTSRGIHSQFCHHKIMRLLAISPWNAVLHGTAHSPSANKRTR